MANKGEEDNLKQHYNIMYLRIINNIIIYIHSMQHTNFFLYPQTRKLITSTLQMNQPRRPLTFLSPPPPPPKRRKSRSTKKVSWKVKEGVKVFNYWRSKHENDIKFREKRVITGTSIHPLRSYPVIRKIIWPLIIHYHINYWASLPGGTTKDLYSLMPRKITMEQLRTDLRYIYACFRQGKLAIVNFNKGLRLPGEIRLGQWCRKKKQYVSYRNFTIAPLLRRYLINVIRDCDMAATSIQVAWLRYKTIKELTRNTAPRSIPASSSSSSVCSTTTTMR